MNVFTRFTILFHIEILYKILQLLIKNYQLTIFFGFAFSLISIYIFGHRTLSAALHICLLYRIHNNYCTLILVTTTNNNELLFLQLAAIVYKLGSSFVIVIHVILKQMATKGNTKIDVISWLHSTYVEGM